MLLQNLIENFSIQNLNAFLRNKITSYNPDNDSLEYYFNETIFNKYKNIEKQGEAKLENGDDLIIITAKTHEPLTDRTGKRNQYEIAKKIIKQEQKDGALFVFYDEQGHFRFSFIKVNYIGTKREFTEFKRYTYFVSKEQTNNTFIQQIGGCDFKSIDEIINAFSVEPLNKQFYIAIQGIFNKLVSTNAVLELPSTPLKDNRKIYQEFAVRLIGRTIFCWFLKNKKSDAGVSLIPNEWLSLSAVRNTQDYYHSILEKLFFLALNTKMEDRQKFDLPEGHTQIPFLNGGLFEPTCDYFENNKCNNNLKIPNTWFEDFFEILEQYNFTIDERSMSDAEVSIDPEMLGTIFENLLAEIDPDTGQSARKSTGSFYTPREIVDYMVEQSLVQYLKTKTDVENEEELLLLFKEGELKNEEHHFDTKTTDELLKALSEVTILDPACGSGAFPMGAVQKIVLALKNLDPTAEKWTEIQLKRFHGNSEIRKKLEQKLKTATSDYARKLGVIQNAIYGVDIQPIATDISKLRSFLSLVIDENIDDTTENRGIEPLPNLEFKFVTANTLLGVNTDFLELDFEDLGEKVNELKNNREKFFTVSSENKRDLIQEDSDLRDEIFRRLLTSTRVSKEIIKRQENEIRFLKKRQRELKEERWVDITESQNDLFGTKATQSLSRKDLNEEKRKEVNKQLKKAENTLQKYIKSRNEELDEGIREDIQKLASWNPYKPNHPAKFFDPKWMFGVEKFDIVIGNPPYGFRTTLNKNEKSFFRKEKSIVFSSGDSAELFSKICFDRFVKENRILSFIIPKKSLYGSAWEDMRINYWHKNQLCYIMDTGKSFANVLLEASVFGLKKNKTNKEIRLSFYDKNKKVNYLGSYYKKQIFTNFNTVQIYKTQFHNSLLDKIEKIKFKETVIIGDLGLAIGKDYFSEEEEEYKLLKGIDIQKYSIRSYRYLKNKEKLNWDNAKKFLKSKVLCQRLIAHIENPYPHLKLTACYDKKGFLITNTLMSFSILNKKISEYFLLSYLNSKFTSWYIYNFVYSRAIRGMDFYNFYIQQVPIPRVNDNIIKKIENLVEKILIGEKKHKQEIDIIFYKVYNLVFEEVLVIDPNFELSKEEYENYNIEEQCKIL